MTCYIWNEPLTLTDKVAKDIMIDRTQLTVIDINKTVNDAIKLYLKTKYSRLPVVADNDKDKILGYVFNYDLIRQKQINGDVSLAKVPPYAYYS